MDIGIDIGVALGMAFLAGRIGMISVNHTIGMVVSSPGISSVVAPRSSRPGNSAGNLHIGVVMCSTGID